VNEAKLAELEPTQSIVKLWQWEDTEAEADEMWSFDDSLIFSDWSSWQWEIHVGKRIANRLPRSRPDCNGQNSARSVWR